LPAWHLTSGFYPAGPAGIKPFGGATASSRTSQQLPVGMRHLWRVLRGRTCRVPTSRERC